MYQTITSILEGIKDKMIQQYRANNLRASGNFEKGFSIGRQGRYKVVLTTPPYTQFITKFKSNKGGRGPGKAPPPRILEKWVKDKGIKIRDLASGRFATRTDTAIKQAAYLIGRKIKEEGTDIYLGKRQPIDLDQIINNRLDYKGEELADRILQEIKI